MTAPDENDFDRDWIVNPTPEELAAMPPVRVITDDVTLPARSPYADDVTDYDDLGGPLEGERLTPPQPRLGDRRFDIPTLSKSLTPNRMPELVPTDPRMRGWRQYDPKKAIAAQRYRGVDVDVHEADDTWHGGRLTLIWEHPATGELRICAAAPLEPWTDPWTADNERVLAEIRQRTTNGGWSYSDSFWTETIKPPPAGAARRRTLPAQYPASTWRNRVRGWWWRMTHRAIDAEIVEQPALPAAEHTTNPRASKPADTEGDWS